MIARRILTSAFAVAIALVVATPGQAGQSCLDHKTTVAELTSALLVATQTETTLNTLSGDYALVARVGGDISEHRLKYTHMAIAERQAEPGHWLVIHQLNPCASGASVLRRHGLANFMLDDLYRHDILVLGLAAEFSRALGATLASERPWQLHEARYSMISNPGLPAKYQNSNQWILELLTHARAALDGQDLRSRKAIHIRYRQDSFKGSMIRISALKRLGARIAAKNIHFDDHPNQSRGRGRFEVVSVQSVIDHFARNGQITGRREIVSNFQPKATPAANGQDGNDDEMGR